MKQLKAKIVAHDNVGGLFYRMRLASSYLAKTAKPGQFVEIRCTQGVDPLLRRPLGVHRITKDGIEILYQVVGKGTALLAEKRARETLDIVGPLGNGFGAAPSAAAILIAGGIGVAPLVALAEEMRGAYVIIGARTRSHVLCEAEFRRAGSRVVAVATEDGSKGHKGLATDLLKDVLRKTADSGRTTVFACGPTAMLKAVATIALAHRIRCQVSLEERMACGVGVCLGCPVRIKTGEYRMVCKDGPVFNAGDIAW